MQKTVLMINKCTIDMYSLTCFYIELKNANRASERLLSPIYADNNLNFQIFQVWIGWYLCMNEDSMEF